MPDRMIFTCQNCGCDIYLGDKQMTIGALLGHPGYGGTVGPREWFHVEASGNPRVCPATFAEPTDPMAQGKVEGWYRPAYTYGPVS